LGGLRRLTGTRAQPLPSSSLTAAPASLSCSSATGIGGRDPRGLSAACPHPARHHPHWHTRGRLAAAGSGACPGGGPRRPSILPLARLLVCYLVRHPTSPLTLACAGGGGCGSGGRTDHSGPRGTGSGGTSGRSPSRTENHTTHTRGRRGVCFPSAKPRGRPSNSSGNSSARGSNGTRAGDLASHCRHRG
jgi:hypothetical protein